MRLAWALLPCLLGAAAPARAQEAPTPPAADDYAQAPPMDDLTAGPPPAELPGPTADAPMATPEAVPPPSPTTVNGYIDSRLTFQRAKVDGLLSTSTLPEVNELIEANVQLKHLYLPHAFVYADASAFGQFAGVYRTQNAQGQEISVGDQDLPQYQPLFSLNEFYVSHDVVPQLNLMLGKKRIVWGPGFSFNPTDIMDPPKDPTNPTFQRAGFWMGRVEANFGEYALTLVAAPLVTGQFASIPFAFVKYPTWDRVDTDAHYQLAARVYWLLFNSDINLMVFFGNKYNDAFANKLRIGASFSRYFFTDYELHVEGLFQSGSAIEYPNAACFGNLQEAAACAAQHQPFARQSRLDDTTIFPHILAGTRRQFNDESVATLEYFYQADGYTHDEFQNFVYLLELENQANQLATAGSSASGGTGSTGIPQNFTFNPSGKHYLIASYSKPKIFDDWTAMLTLIASLNDLSTFISPNIAWSATEWATLSLFAFVAAPGPDSLAAKTTTNAHVSEFSLINSTYRILFEVRLFY